MKRWITFIAVLAALAAVAGAFIFPPQIITVVPGHRVGGNLVSLFNRDDSPSVVRNGVRVSLHDNPVGHDALKTAFFDSNFRGRLAS